MAHEIICIAEILGTSFKAFLEDASHSCCSM